MVIPAQDFLARDLTRPLEIDRRFDLAMSMEVAEHLPEARSASFVADLTRLAPAVLFSAAVPGQGGIEHMNERWQSDWIGLFAAQGFEAWDVVRPATWDDEDVAFCYRQNMFLFVDPAVHGSHPDRAPVVADLVHPRLLDLAVAPPPPPTLREISRVAPLAAWRAARYRLDLVRNRLRP